SVAPRTTVDHEPKRSAARARETPRPSRQTSSLTRHLCVCSSGTSALTRTSPSPTATRFQTRTAARAIGYRPRSAKGETTMVRLTQFAKRAGCAAKHPPGYLFPLLGGLPKVTDPNVLVGSATADDAAIYRLSSDVALV